MSTPMPTTKTSSGQGDSGGNASPENLLVPDKDTSGVTPVSSPGGESKSPASTTTPSSSIHKKAPKDYVFGKMVGEGSFSSVYLAKDVITSKEYAIKVCDKNHIIREKKAKSIGREKDMLTLLSTNWESSAPFFVHLYATFQDERRLYFVMTFAYGGELLQQLNKCKTFNKETSQFYAAEIVQALRHMHKLKICHRDLKPENILLNENGHILITDFGSGKILEKIPTAASEEPEKGNADQPSSGRARSNSFVGTAQYVSPEILQGRYNDVGPAADLWALGCIIYQFFTGLTPFQAPTEFLIFRKILALEYQFPDEFDADAKDLITKLLQIQFTDRLGALDMEYYTSIQNHTFFTGVEFDVLHEMTVPLFANSDSETDSIRNHLRLQAKIPDDYAPGFDPRVIAERFLRSDSDENETWETAPPQSSEDSEESAKSESVTPSDTINSNLSETMTRMNVGSGIDEKERLARLEEQSIKNEWHQAANENLIVKEGFINKKKGLFSRKRKFLLTEGPHLFYCDPNTKVVKGEIPWSSTLRAEAKDFRVFHVITPNRTYYLEDPKGFALSWVEAINRMTTQ